MEANTMLNLIKFVLKVLFGNSASGTLIVSSSVPQVDIKTGWTPKHVFISLENNHGTPVCGAHNDWFDVKIVHHGFIIQCNVKSSFRKITWIATE